SKVVQVIIDNATNCNGERKIIERTHPHVFWSGCLVHTLKLLMHDIVKHKECGWINELYKKEKQLINFFI
ncbi:DUF domain-containing protein, partial [Bacteroides uniformis]|uniref:DUF domain-containing protein n=1 Tax=Bacteroides uniformis TaxID=820 RepID=UPI001AA173D5